MTKYLDTPIYVKSTRKYYMLSARYWPTFCGGRIVDAQVWTDTRYRVPPATCDTVGQMARAIVAALPRFAYMLVSPEAYAVLRHGNVKRTYHVATYTINKKRVYLLTTASNISEEGIRSIALGPYAAPTVRDVSGAAVENEDRLLAALHGVDHTWSCDSALVEEYMRQWKLITDETNSLPREAFLKGYTSKVEAPLFTRRYRNGNDMYVLEYRREGPIWAGLLTGVGARFDSFVLNGMKRTVGAPAWFGPPCVVTTALHRKEDTPSALFARVNTLVYRELRKRWWGHKNHTAWLSDNSVSGLMNNYPMETRDYMSLIANANARGRYSMTINGKKKLYFYFNPFTALNPNSQQKHTAVAVVSLYPIKRRELP